MKTRIFLLLALVLMLVPMEAAKRKVHTIGDSTMSSYQPAATPKRGWGMYLQVFFNPDSVEVNNRGKSGASTRTFYETENLWPSVKKQMRAGDYLIIQFAHNDEKCKGEDVYVKNVQLRSEGKDTLTDMRGTEPNTTYKAYLRKFINEAREMGVTPILMSPICRAYFKDGKINSEGRHVLSAEKDYVRCMREVAEEMNVPFLDMTAASCAFYESRGKEFCMEHYFNCGEKTHTSAQGGMAIATLAYSLIVENRETNLRLLTNLPTQEEVEAYAQAIEESGKKAAFAAFFVHCLRLTGCLIPQTPCVASLRRFYQLHQFIYGFRLGNVAEDRFFALVERNLSGPFTHVAIVGIGHLSGAVHYAAHYGYHHVL